MCEPQQPQTSGVVVVDTDMVGGTSRVQLNEDGSLRARRRFISSRTSKLPKGGRGGVGGGGWWCVCVTGTDGRYTNDVTDASFRKPFLFTFWICLVIAWARPGRAGRRANDRAPPNHLRDRVPVRELFAGLRRRRRSPKRDQHVTRTGTSCQ